MHTLSAILVAALLTACGGGGDSGVEEEDLTGRLPVLCAETPRPPACI